MFRVTHFNSGHLPVYGLPRVMRMPTKLCYFFLHSKVLSAAKSYTLEQLSEGVALAAKKERGYGRLKDSKNSVNMC